VQTNFRDFICWLIACLGVCFLGVELGLGVSIGLSLFLYILETSFPHLAILGRVDKTDLAASTEQFPGVAKAVPGLLALRLDAPLYFGNVQYLEDKIDAFLEEADANAREGTGEIL
jgi:MFS superfamily sulfate permease-like transporter